MNRDRLDWAHITKASQIMLVAYPIFLAWLGLTYLFTPEDRLALSPTFQTASKVAPMEMWGVLFLMVCGLQVAALFAHNRNMYTVSLSFMLGIMLVWFAIFAVAIFQTDASPGGPAWPALAMVATVATGRSLEYQEAQK